MNEQPNTVTINVLADRSREARDRLNKLVRKAARYSVNPVSYTVGEVQIVKRQYEGWDGEVCTANVAVVPFTVTGLLPVIGKHTFLARLEHTDAGNIISKVPGSDIAIANRYRAATPCCEHCKTQRARKDTFVILDRETNEQKQVGRSCLADYVKTGTAASIIASLANYAEGEDIERTFGGSDFHFSQTLEFIVTATLIAIRKFGWLSRANANEHEPSTSSHVASLWGFSKEARAMAAELRKAWQPGDEEMARKVISWVREEMRVDNDYYQHNLRVAYTNDVLSSPRNIGLVCSGVASYQRVQEALIRREFERTKLLKSQHVGTVGERLRDVEVTYLNSRGLGENGFGGYTHLHKFITKDGHVLSWITTSELDHKTKQGVVAKLTATVKEHREYAGIKETAVSRAKLA